MPEGALNIGVLAGEASGDILGAAVLQELAQRHTQMAVSGIGGDLMAAQGLHSLVPMDRLSVMGLIEPLKRLPELLRIRQAVYNQQIALRPDLFLGIDSPDFNLTLERKLRRSGMTTAHLVSPSVWAWRPGRIRRIAEAVDLMLCLLPFEVPIYEQAGIPAVCVGHPLIEELPLLPDKATARIRLGFADNDTVVAVMPGSRAAEVRMLMPLFKEAMLRLVQVNPALRFVIPAASPHRREQIMAVLEGVDLPVEVIEAQGRLAMVAADSVLLASGTATLEAMLLRRPMVIAYRLGAVSWQVLSRMAITRFVGLPNILADREIVPELLQDAATPSAIADAIMGILAEGDQTQVPVFEELAERIGADFAPRAADALEGLLSR
ncbi:lipid-A-disaccharide synthase [Luminiphilus syltensis NOR5-1B]|uniref:Lipid-A-disaccharide synthase n=1 Tax=Luminiphilus syltensis NOR5-1B TaxID=565045 RepID=B8KY88_9GAMM|nr:lipid-A-disaccharide synthase [Luminiphilus syltensis]EED35780.1 lipid-A-disaccharide synthase [Luminiphilus syltensis NOR5-1B]